MHTHVTKVVWQPHHVVVHGQEASGADVQIHAARVVITVPLGVLQADTIEFLPRPAEIFEQVHRLAMGDALRVMLVFQNRFWCDPGAFVGGELADMSFFSTPHETPQIWWTAIAPGAPVLTAWAGGPQANRLTEQFAATRDPRALVHHCLETLSKAFGRPLKDLETRLVRAYFHDWHADPYARGAYSYVPAGALDAPERLARAVEGTLYFAGEHTDISGHWGTVHAALAAGAHAAALISGLADV